MIEAALRAMAVGVVVVAVVAVMAVMAVAVAKVVMGTAAEVGRLREVCRGRDDGLTQTLVGIKAQPSRGGCRVPSKALPVPHCPLPAALWRLCTSTLTATAIAKISPCRSWLQT